MAGRFQSSRPSLTLNLGLRYEIVTPQYEDNNHLANFNHPATASLVQASSGSLFNRAQVNPRSTTTSGPRFGFALFCG